MFMTQNASVETVAARMHRIEMNDFMLKAQVGYSIELVTKSVLQVRDRSWKRMAMDHRAQWKTQRTNDAGGALVEKVVLRGRDVVCSGGAENSGSRYTRCL